MILWMPSGGAGACQSHGFVPSIVYPLVLDERWGKQVKSLHRLRRLSATVNEDVNAHRAHVFRSRNVIQRKPGFSASSTTRVVKLWLVTRPSDFRGSLTHIKDAVVVKLGKIGHSIRRVNYGMDRPPTLSMHRFQACRLLSSQQGESFFPTHVSVCPLQLRFWKRTTSNLAQFVCGWLGDNSTAIPWWLRRCRMIGTSRW